MREITGMGLNGPGSDRMRYGPSATLNPSGEQPARQAQADKRKKVATGKRRNGR